MIEAELRRVTVAEMADATGVSPRAVQLWTDELILLADPESLGAGRGVKRTYNVPEIYVAAVARVLFDQGMKLRNISGVAGMVRSTILRSGDGVTEAIRLAKAGNGPVFLAFRLPPQGNPPEDVRVGFIPGNIENLGQFPIKCFEDETPIAGSLYGLIEISSIFAGIE